MQVQFAVSMLVGSQPPLTVVPEGANVLFWRPWPSVLNTHKHIWVWWSIHAIPQIKSSTNNKVRSGETVHLVTVLAACRARQSRLDLQDTHGAGTQQLPQAVLSPPPTCHSTWVYTHKIINAKLKNCKCPGHSRSTRTDHWSPHTCVHVCEPVRTNAQIQCLLLSFNNYQYRAILISSIILQIHRIF